MLLCNFKIGDIVKSKDNVIFRISQIGYCGLAVYGKNLVNNEQKYYSSEEVKKVTFYEMLDFIKYRYMELIINKPKLDILNCLIDFTSGITKDISYIYDSFDNSATLSYYINLNSNNLYVDFDNLDYEKDLKEIELKKKMNEALDIAEANLKDAFKKSMIYGEELTVGEFLNKCCNSYFDLTNNDNKKVEVNMTREQVANAVKDMFRQLNKPEPKEDTVFVNNKKKTTVIKWADGELTKATCDKEDKYDLEKGVMVAMLKKYYTVDEINSFIDKAKESQEKDMNKWREKENKKVKETLKEDKGELPVDALMGLPINSKKSKKKKDDIDLDDLPF